MDKTNQDQHEVCGVTLPPEFAGVKLTKAGLPDKRDARYAEVMAWIEAQKAAEPVEPIEPVASAVVYVDRVADPAAQALASRIFAGQSPDLLMPDRLARVKAGLEEQGLSMEGVIL